MAEPRSTGFVTADIDRRISSDKTTPRKRSSHSVQITLARFRGRPNATSRIAEQAAELGDVVANRPISRHDGSNPVWMLRQHKEPVRIEQTI